MANLIGQSENPDVAGVYGEGDGAGVWGKSKTWVGVIGETESSDTNAGGAGVWGKGVVGFGVHGESQAGIGVMGDSTWIGVKGETKTLKGIGVLGVHNAGGSAVIGVSEEQGGIGIHGKGGHRAGFFEGNVEITGDLTVQGISIQSLLQRIQQLEQKVAALSSGSGSTPQPAIVSCGVEPFSPGSEFNLLRILGHGFKAGEEVSLKITSTQQGQNPFTEIRQTTTDSSGGIDYRYSGSGGGVCGNVPTTFQVQGTGLTSSKVSNVATSGC